MSKRGFSCVAVDGVKRDPNIGGVLRAAHAFSADLVVLNTRIRRYSQDTSNARKQIPTITVEDVLSVVPHDCIPVAVDLVAGARSICDYTHPERAFYIFGGEDRTLDTRIIGGCRDVIYIPTAICLNLACAVNVVLYDRALKRKENITPVKFTREFQSET